MMTSVAEPLNILITGAAGALGSALAIACAARGARVLLIDRDLRGLSTTCERVEATGGPGPGYCQLDLGEAGRDQFVALVREFRDAYGPLTGLVHGAARFHALQPLEQVTPDEWLKTLQVNLNACWSLTLACLPDLRAQAGSSVVFVLDGLAGAGRAYWGPYGISKAGLQCLTQMFAEELEGTRCRVFGVETGPIRSALRSTAYLAEHPAKAPDAERVATYIAGLLLEPKANGDVLQRVSVD